jgi:hypothetical protein
MSIEKANFDEWKQVRAEGEAEVEEIRVEESRVEKVEWKKFGVEDGRGGESSGRE